MNNYELMAINQALFYIRFNCVDPNTVNIKCSDFLIEAHLKILNELDKFYIQEGISISYDGFIEEQIENYMPSIITTIKNIENWKELNNEIKIQQIKSLVSPYKIKKETIKYLLNL